MSNWANQEKEREKIQITTTKNEGGAITTNPTDFKRIKEYYELFAHKSNLNEMDQFLERHNMPKLTQEIVWIGFYQRN